MLSRDSDIHAAKELKMYSDSNQSSAKPDVLKSSVSMVRLVRKHFVGLNYG